MSVGLLLALIWTFGLSLLKPLILLSPLGKFGLLNNGNHYGAQFHAVAFWGAFHPCGAMPLTPDNRDEISQAGRRGGNVLQTDRIVLQSTRDRRVQLLSAFDEWIAANLRTTREDLLDTRALDPELVWEGLRSRKIIWQVL